MEQPIKKNKFSFFARSCLGFILKRSGNEISFLVKGETASLVEQFVEFQW